MGAPLSRNYQQVAEAQAAPTSTTVAAAATIGPLVTADAGRRRLIVTNPPASTAKLGLSVKATATFAQCEIVLSPGESWVEALCASAAWYVITETGSISAPVQTAV